MPTRQINVFFYKKETEKDELLARPDLNKATPTFRMFAFRALSESLDGANFAVLTQ